MGKHYSLGIFDYERVKICDLYDSELELTGQAYGIEASVEMNGYHTLTFNIPYIVDEDKTKNFRWDYLKSEYLIRYSCDGENTWYVANKPTKAKSGKKIYGNVICSGYESLLKTRNIYMEFDDENGIGTIQYLMEQILLGTMWSFDANRSDTMLENDGHTEKVRSLNTSGKQGSLGLITTVCNLFQARPVFDTENMVVYVKALNNRQQVLEGEVGRNLNSLSHKQDSSNICTRIYVEGEYGDFGYVGIDDVMVDGEPWGLPFVLNFDYYREIGVFKQEHEDALEEYLEDIRSIKTRIRTAAADLIECEDGLNNMVGQCDFVVYYKNESLDTPKYVYGVVTPSQATLRVNDDVVILKSDTHTYEKWSGNPSSQLSDAYGVVKFITKAAGKIGAAEVQVEAKEKEIERLNKKISALPASDPKIAEYQRSITNLENEINIVFIGSQSSIGLYDMMQNVMKSSGMLYNKQRLSDRVDMLNDQQDDIESTFIAAMGFMLRDGYWSNQNYITGQEEFLYADAVDMAKEMSKPVTDYTFDYVRITEDFDIPPEDIEINAIFKLYDKELQVDDKMFIKRITYGVDNKRNGKIEVSNQDITLTGSDLGSLLSRMSQLADLIEQKNALYERAKAISESGSIYADRLNGQIDVLKTQILSSVSNWHTDENGNIMFESADGNGAMMLSGAGFMLASEKLEDGSWNWRAFGDSSGFTADEIVAGFISADRIEAGSIQASHLASDVGESLDLSSNVSINAIVQNEVGQAAAQFELTESEFNILFDNTVRDEIETSIGDVQSNLDDYEDQVSVYMRFDETGTLTLGKEDESFSTQITNKKLAFLDGSTEVAFISNQNMYITNANVTEALAIGTVIDGLFEWTVTNTGLGLKWREVKKNGSLTITKTVQTTEGDPIGNTPSYPIVVIAELNGVTYYVQNASGSLAQSPPDISLVITAGTDLTISNLPYGNYTVMETDPENVVIVGYNYVVTEDSRPAGDAVIDEDPGTINLVNIYEAEE